MKRRRNDLVFDMHLSMINSEFQPKRRVSKFSKFRSITIYFGFRVCLQAVWGTYLKAKVICLNFSLIKTVDF